MIYVRKMFHANTKDNYILKREMLSVFSGKLLIVFMITMIYCTMQALMRDIWSNITVLELLWKTSQANWKWISYYIWVTGSCTVTDQKPCTMKISKFQVYLEGIISALQRPVANIYSGIPKRVNTHCVTINV